MATERDLAEVILRERLHLMAATQELTPEELEAYRRRVQREHVGPGFEGKYGFVDDRLYVSVDSVTATLARSRAPAYLLRPVLRVIIAHELAHALQDQHTPMEQLLQSAQGDDAVMAMNCVFEGHAVWVHEAVAAQLGLTEAGALMVELMGYEVPFEGRMSPELFYSRYVYGAGRDFVAFHAFQGGTEQVWDVLSHPPITTAEIMDPERYPHEGTGTPSSVERSFDRISARLGPRNWETRRAMVGDYDVRDQLVRSGGDLAAADALTDGWSLASVGQADKGAQVQVLRFSTGAKAQRFVSQMLRRSAAQAQSSRTLPFLDVRVGTFDVVKGDLAAFTSMRLRIEEGPPDRQDRLWVVRGTDVVEVMLVNVTLGKRRLRRVFSRAFRGLRGHPS